MYLAPPPTNSIKEYPNTILGLTNEQKENHVKIDMKIHERQWARQEYMEYMLDGNVAQVLSKSGLLWP